MVPNVAGSSPVIRPMIKQHPNGVFFYDVWAVRARTAGSGRSVSVVKGAHGVKTNMGIYSPVIRPMIKQHPNGVFFIEKLCVLWYNARIQRTTFGRLFLLPAFAGVFYLIKRSF